MAKMSFLVVMLPSGVCRIVAAGLEESMDVIGVWVYSDTSLRSIMRERSCVTNLYGHKLQAGILTAAFALLMEVIFPCQH